MHSKCSINVKFCYDDGGTFIHSTGIDIIMKHLLHTRGDTTKEKRKFLPYGIYIGSLLHLKGERFYKTFFKTKSCKVRK